MRHCGGVSGGLIKERVPPAGVLTPSTSANMTVGMQKLQGNKKVGVPSWPCPDSH